MKKSKLIVLTWLLIPTTISIPVIVNFNFSKKHSHSINNQSNNTNANELINSLNYSIKLLREKITQIDSQITALEDQKNKKEAELIPARQELMGLEKQFEQIQKDNEEIEQKIREVKEEIEKLQDEIHRIDEIIEELKDEIELNQNLITEQENELSDFKSNEIVIEDLLKNTWTKKMEGTIWAGEKCGDLLKRFEKVSGIKLELQNPHEEFNSIENNNKSNNDNILKVKLKSMNFDVLTVVDFPLTREKNELDNVLQQIGYDDNGKIKPISPNIIEVPEKLPWFITNLDNAFQFTQAEEIRNLDKWDTSNVTSMQQTFSETSTFNQSLDRWNVSKVRNFRKILWSASNFTKSIASWNINESAVTDDFMNVDIPIYRTRNSFLWEACVPQKIRERFDPDKGQNGKID